MVGASYVAGNLEKLEKWVLASNRMDLLRFFSFRLANSAFVDIERLNWFLHRFVADADMRIEGLTRPFAAVCTDRESGREVLLQEGGVSGAVRASMAMPGLFPAERNQQRWLVDGGLVNPIPVSACRLLGADFVIGINLNSDILSRRHFEHSAAVSAPGDGIIERMQSKPTEASSTQSIDSGESDSTPGLFSAIANTINIFQDQITRGRLDTDPADVLIAPKVSNIGMFDFQRAADAIAEGEASVRNALEDIQGHLREISACDINEA